MTPFYIPVGAKVPISSYPHQYLFSVFFDSSLPNGCEVITHAVLICISLMISDVVVFYVFVDDVFLCVCLS